MTSHKLLNQDDYHGIRIKLNIKDNSLSMPFTIDVGVHTLLKIKQNETIFDYDSGNNKLIIKTNPPEQMIAEKLYALAKIGPTSTRMRDVYDIYYLLNKCKIDNEICTQCFKLLTRDQKHGLKNVDDIVKRINNTFEDKEFTDRVQNSQNKWLDVDFTLMKKKILDFVSNL